MLLDFSDPMRTGISKLISCCATSNAYDPPKYLNAFRDDLQFLNSIKVAGARRKNNRSFLKAWMEYAYIVSGLNDLSFI